MPKIDLDTQGLDRITMMLVGDSRSGKTRCAATCPRPFFLSDAPERGWTTLQYMNDDGFYEPGKKPQVFTVADAGEFVDGLEEIKRIAANPKTRWDIGTVVIDSLTFYADTWFSQREIELRTSSQASGKGYDPRHVYQDLASHLRYLMIQIHKLPYNIVWTCLPKEGGEPGSLGGAMIAGQTATKAPARCDLWGYLCKVETGGGENTRVDYQLHTQNYAGFKAGHRFGDRLPRVMSPSFKELERRLDMTVWRSRYGLPDPEPIDEQAESSPSKPRRRRRRKANAEATA